jgi:hypothetical protein
LRRDCRGDDELGWGIELISDPYDDRSGPHLTVRGGPAATVDVETIVSTNFAVMVEVDVKVLAAWVWVIVWVVPGNFSLCSSGVMDNLLW